MGSTLSPETDVWDLDRLRLPAELVGDVSGRRRPLRHRPGEPFIKGPISYPWIASACRLPGSGLHVAMAYRFHFWRFRFRRGRHWGLDDVAVGLRISANSVRRGLHAAELAGLLAVEQKPGCKLSVSVLDLPGPIATDLSRRSPIAPRSVSPIFKALRCRRRADRVIWAGLGRAPNARKGIPTIVVEFVSGSKRSRRRDSVEKRAEYLAVGVREYWIIDRFAQTLTACRCEGPDVVVPHDRTYRTPLLPWL